MKTKFLERKLFPEDYDFLRCNPAHKTNKSYLTKIIQNDTI